MASNYEIYVIGSAVLFLLIVFLYIRKISNSGELKVKIESVSDSIDSEIIENENISNKSIVLSPKVIKIKNYDL